MKVLFVSTSSGSRGGGELYLVYLAKELTGQGVKVALWCSSNRCMDELADLFKEFGPVFRSHYINTYDRFSRSLWYLLPSRFDNIYPAIIDFAPDVIHLNKQNLEDGLDLIHFLDKIQVPYISTIHITQSQHFLKAILGKARDIVSKRCLLKSKSNYWVAIGPARAEDLGKFLGTSDRVVLIPNAVSLISEPDMSGRRQIRKEFNIEDHQQVVISVGRLVTQKNPLQFVDWAQSSLMQFPDARFFWVGDGDLRQEFEESVESKGLNEKIVCLGWRKDVANLYLMADIYLHTAEFEGLAFSILEAMSWGLPIVAPESLCVDIRFDPDVILSGYDGLIKALSDVRFRRRQGLIGRKYVEDRYSWNHVVHKYIELYSKVLEI